MQIRKNDPSQYAQQTGRSKDSNSVQGKEALTSVEREKAAMEMQGKPQKAKVSITPVPDLMNAVEQNTKSKLNIKAMDENEPNHGGKIVSEKSMSEKMRHDLNILSRELEDYLKQSRILIKAGKVDDYEKLFKKMVTKLNDMIIRMKKDNPEKHFIIDNLTKWDANITKQAIMDLSKEKQEVNQIIIENHKKE